MDPPREGGRSSRSNQDGMCFLCGDRILSESSPNEIPIGSDLPGGICHCFLPSYNDIPGYTNSDVPEEGNFLNEENTRHSDVKIAASEHSKLHVGKEECYTEKSNDNSQKDTSINESKTSEYSFSSDGYLSSPNESFLYSRRKTPVGSGKSSKSSPSTENSVSSSGYALSLLEQSSDQDSSDQINVESSSPGEESRKSSNPEKDVSSGYALSLDEQSLDENLAKNTSPRFSENSKKYFKADNDESCTQSLYESSFLEQLNVSEFKSNKSFSSNQTEISYNWTRRESDCQSELKSNRNENIHQNIPPELVPFRSPHPRPECPRPFPSLHAPAHPPNRNIAMNIPILGPSLPRPHHHTLSTQPYNPTINMPVNRTNFPGRFPVVSRPQIISHHQHSDNKGNRNLSQKLSTEAKKENTEENCVKVERIENWLEDIENALPFEDASASAHATGWSAIENDDEAILEWALAASTDERSSTEISEEEYRKQMAEKRPPRKNKKK